MSQVKEFRALLAENTRLVTLHEDLAKSVAKIRSGESRGWEHDINRDTRPSVAILYTEILEARSQIDALAMSRWVPAPVEVV